MPFRIAPLSSVTREWCNAKRHCTLLAQYAALPGSPSLSDGTRIKMRATLSVTMPPRIAANRPDSQQRFDLAITQLGIGLKS